ncbi:hypothetical protein G7074_04645 [Pedobacter sp. HDW13]|uniref:hypothetical protein n=1 Tax=Pedobacter sp. HDW13 TaxID=2714940 RepID=UPI00140D44E9|nr:hypothetical protein [Pedobacter sp. HDW13]QIL38629.1 hypothetical protein G7074_04645 [Pedobacter sp. HDW13]
MKKIIMILFVTVIIGCGKDKEPIVEEPAAAKTMLFKPAQNELCTSGVIISDSQSVVTFEWVAAANADGYELVVKNLESGSVNSYFTQNLRFDVKLQRNTPYSWSVDSKSDKNPQTTKSDVWKFFNAGVGISSYAPYPADLLSPSFGETVNAVDGKLSLLWKGSDPDNDILNYSIYLGKSTSPILLKADLTDTVLKDISVSINTVYYWKVITKDNRGNTSDSGLFSFKVK